MWLLLTMVFALTVLVGNGILVYSLFHPASEEAGYYVPEPGPELDSPERAVLDSRFNCKWNLRRSNPGPARRWGRKAPPGTRWAARCRRRRRLVVLAARAATVEGMLPSDVAQV